MASTARGVLQLLTLCALAGTLLLLHGLPVADAKAYKGPCGRQGGGKRCHSAHCCSRVGTCGNRWFHCGKGCQGGHCGYIHRHNKKRNKADFGASSMANSHPKPQQQPQQQQQQQQQWKPQPQNTAQSQNGGGGSHHGDGTFYRQEGQKTSCGNIHSDWSMTVAMNAPDMQNGNNPNLNPQCHKLIRACGLAGCAVLEITNTCPECARGSIDMSYGAFQKVVGDWVIGRSPVSWDYI